MTLYPDFSKPLAMDINEHAYGYMDKNTYVCVCVQLSGYNFWLLISFQSNNNQF